MLCMLHMIYRCNMHYSLLVEGLFRYNAHFVITPFLLGSHHQRYTEVAVYYYFRFLFDQPTSLELIHFMPGPPGDLYILQARVQPTLDPCAETFL